MNEGLEALKRIGNMPTQNNMGITMINTLRDYDIIEKELKRLYELDNGAYVSIHINRYNELCDKEEIFEIIKDRLIVEDKSCYIQVVCDFSIPSKYENYDKLKEALL